MPEERRSLSYRDAGVNIDAASDSLKRVKEAITRTFDHRVLRGIGSFGAMYQPDLSGLKEPVIVSSVDGVGTKLKVAFMSGRHDTVGIDIVSHCVNDILVQGAKPLFFLDYLAVGHLEPGVVEAVILGVTVGCRYAGCALIGGETAEMPGMYADGEYDLAGTIVGIVDREKIVDGASIQAGDKIIGLASSGLHTNGYSLARKICFEVEGLGVDDMMEGVGFTVADALLEPHRSYSRVIQVLSKLVKIKGMVHVTGGGITDNTPRILPEGLGARVDLTTWRVPPLFRFLQERGGVSTPEMLRTFNCGKGYLAIVSPDDAERAIRGLAQGDEPAQVIGEIVEDPNGEVSYDGELQYADYV